MVLQKAERECNIWKMKREVQERGSMTVIYRPEDPKDLAYIMQATLEKLERFAVHSIALTGISLPAVWEIVEVFEEYLESQGLTVNVE